MDPRVVIDLLIRHLYETTVERDQERIAHAQTRATLAEKDQGLDELQARLTEIETQLAAHQTVEETPPISGARVP